MFSFDVGQAFAKGMAFEEFSALSGQDIRKVEFDVPKADVYCLRALFDFNDLDPVEETLVMLKPIYGLKDAPRAWRKTLHQVLVPWMSCRQLYAGPGLYCVHKDDARCRENIYQRAQEHNEEQQAICNYRKVGRQAHVKGILQCLFSVHCDYTKGAATK